MSDYAHPGDDFTDDSEAVLLARCIFGEARSEEDRGRYAVGFVVKNRTRDKDRTYHQVILQPAQFSCFNPGDPNYEKLKDPEQFDAEAWERCLEIAREIVACNDDRNPVGDATHYHADGVSPGWTETGRQTVRVGSHLFYENVPYSVPDDPSLLREEDGMSAGLDEELDRLLKKADLLDRLAEHAPLTEEQIERLRGLLDGLLDEIERELDGLAEGADGGEGDGAGESGAGEGGAGVPSDGDAEMRELLQRGDSGPDVERLQRALREAGHYDGAIDGDYGPKTESAVEAYQEANDLQVDGKAGPETQGALGLTD